jgi:hypothetical protein
MRHRQGRTVKGFQTIVDRTPWSDAWRTKVVQRHSPNVPRDPPRWRRDEWGRWLLLEIASRDSRQHDDDVQEPLGHILIS